MSNRRGLIGSLVGGAAGMTVFFWALKEHERGLAVFATAVFYFTIMFLFAMAGAYIATKGGEQ